MTPGAISVFASAPVGCANGRIRSAFAGGSAGYGLPVSERAGPPIARATATRILRSGPSPDPSDEPRRITDYASRRIVPFRATSAFIPASFIDYGARINSDQSLATHAACALTSRW